jgi:hypothetical protein
MTGEERQTSNFWRLSLRATLEASDFEVQKRRQKGSEKAGDWRLAGAVSAENAVCEVTRQSGRIWLEGPFTP